MGMMIIGMFFETLGLGLLLPALNLMSSDSKILANLNVIAFFKSINLTSQTEIVSFVFILLMVVNFIKMIVMSIIVGRQSRFIYNLQMYFSEKLFVGYLYQPYTFHLQRNSAQLIRNVTSLIVSLTTTLSAVLNLLTELITFIGIGIFLFYIQPLGMMIVAAVFGSSVYIFQLLSKKKLIAWGQEFNYHEGMRIQHIQQGLGAAKDLILLGREGDFLKKYSLHNFKSAKIGEKQLTLQSVPRYLFEFLALVSISSLTLFMIFKGYSFSVILPSLGLFAAAALRLMPSINRVMSTLQQIKYGQPAIDELSNELSLISLVKVHPIVNSSSFKYDIELKDVFFSYYAGSKNVVNGVSIKIKKGTMVGFIGSSGAGKSTLIDLILGLLSPGIGSILVDGKDIKNNIRGWQKQIGYVPQVIFLTDDSLRNNIAFGLPEDEINEDALKRAILDSQLEKFIEQLPEGLNTFVGERGVRLSGGQRQRIGIARALYHNPDILIMDEATSSLDNETELGVIESVTALHGIKTIIVIAHRLSTVSHCDKIFKLENGKIINEGTVKDVLNSEPA
jgi:ABC-type multidrug transport system fused ATPase/permease subunit